MRLRTLTFLFLTTFVNGCQRMPSEPELPELPRRAERLTITTEPSGAEIMIDGEVLGTTPLTLTPSPTGKHAIELRLHGFPTWMKTVGLGWNETLHVAMRPYPGGTLFISVGDTLKSMRTDGSERRTVVVARGKSSVSPNGRYLSRHAEWALHIFDLNGSLIQRVDSVDTFSWAPDSRSVVFVKVGRHDFGLGLGTYGLNIYVVELGQTPRHVARWTTGDILYASFSPNGETIAFFERSAADWGSFFVKTVTPTGNNLTTVFNGHRQHPGGWLTGPPQWINDHEFIFVLSDHYGGVFHTDLSTGETALWIEDFWLQCGLSTDGRMLLCNQAYPFCMFFASMVEGSGYPWDRSGSDECETRLRPLHYSQFSWSPDGQTVALIPPFYDTLYLIWLGDDATYRAFVDSTMGPDGSVPRIAWRP